MERTHRYQVEVDWTGNLGQGTSGYRAYRRTNEVRGQGKPPVPGSSDPAFRGEADRWNPEELLVAYTDAADGTMLETGDGGGHFTEVVLRPVVTVASPEMADKAAGLHGRAHELCYIANSVNFPVRHQPTTVVA